MGNNSNFKHSIPNALMISKPKVPFWDHVINIMKKRVNKGIPEYDTGPILLKDAYDSYPNKEKILILDEKYFYPINWNTEKKDKIKIYKKLQNKTKKEIFPDSYAITYWTHSWEKNNNKVILISTLVPISVLIIIVVIYYYLK